MIQTPLSLVQYTSAVSVLAVIALALATIIVVKAFRGYQQNNDPAMLLLAGGLFLLVLAPTLIELTTALAFEESIDRLIVMNILQHLLRIAGLGAILASMYVGR